MRVAGAHRGAAILKDLHVIDLRHRSHFLELRRPGMDHTFDIFRLHRGECEVVARRKADHTAKSGFAFGYNQSPVFHVHTVAGCGRLQRGKVIVEDERVGIPRINDSASPGISRTEIAGRVIFRLFVNGNVLELPLPGSACPMRRNQHPLVGKRVQSAMRIFSKLQFNSDGWVTMYAKALRTLSKGYLTGSGEAAYRCAWL